MQKLGRYPLIFFLIAASIGLLLRVHFLYPIPGLKFPYWLHAHSHLMFLGWVVNLLFLAFIYEFIDSSRREKYITLYRIIQILLVGMLISFPLQGYGLYSITLSTLHTVAVGVFAIWFFKDAACREYDPSQWFASISLIFFLISALGPFSLGPLMVNGLEHTKWYYFAVYYYLHFQYNGVFTFGVFSLFFGLLKERGVNVDQLLAKRFGNLMWISCFPAYFLSTLWAQPGIFLNIIGMVAAILQGVALVYFIKIIRSIPESVMKNVALPARLLLGVAFLSFTLKLILQALSALPAVAQLAGDVRNFVMAYLHLVLLGMVTTFLLAWNLEKKWIHSVKLIWVIFFLLGFAGMEIILVTSPNYTLLSLYASPLLVIFSSMILVGIAGFLAHSMLGLRKNSSR